MRQCNVLEADAHRLVDNDVAGAAVVGRAPHQQLAELGDTHRIDRPGCSAHELTGLNLRGRQPFNDDEFGPCEQASSSSRAAGLLEPTAAMNVPGLTHVPSNKGSVARVAVTITSASLTAVLASTALAVTPNSVFSQSAKSGADARPATHTRSNGWTSSSASACARACTPVPKIASERASRAASRCIATAVAAAVRKRVISFAAIVASASPVTEENSTMTKLKRPWIVEYTLAPTTPAAGSAAPIIATAATVS